MQIIDTLEPSRRGPYGGGIGHVSFTGGMDMALALRTMARPARRAARLWGSAVHRACKPARGGRWLRSSLLRFTRPAGRRRRRRGTMPLFYFRICAAAAVQDGAGC